MNVDIWQTIAIVVSLAVFFLGFWATRNKNLYTENNTNGNISSLLAKINQLEAHIAERDRRIQELTTEMNIMKKDRADSRAIMQSTIDTLQSRVAFLENLLYKEHEEQKPVTSTPKILLIAANKQIQKSDEIALRKARVPYRRIVDATIDKIDNEFRRRRSEGKMYPYLVFSMHMNEDGMELFDGQVLDSYWLNTNLSGDVKLVLLNGCSSTKIADDLFGVVDYIISMTEKIDSEDAATFLYSFWRNFKSSGIILESYNNAKQAVPSAAAFIDIQYNDDNSSEEILEV